MKTWIDMAPFVAMYAADCPVFTIAEEAQLAAVEFFADTRVWRSEDRILLATTTAGQAAYSVTNPANTEIVGLPAVWLGNREIGEALQRDRADLATEPVGRPEKLALITGVTVRLLPTPQIGGEELRATVAYGPTMAAAGIADDAVYLAHRETLRELTLAKLKRMQGKPWSDPRAAEQHQREYEQRASDASTLAGPRRRNRLRTKHLKV